MADTRDPVADLLRRTRVERGLPPRVTDPDVLARVARLLRVVPR